MTSTAGSYAATWVRGRLRAACRATKPPPLERMVDLACRIRDLYAAHPWLVDVVSRGVAPGPHTLAFFERCLAVLAPVDAPASAKFESVALVTGLATLFARPAPGGTAYPWGGIVESEHPHLAAAVVTVGGQAPAGGLFERAVRGLLRGLLPL